MSKSAITIKAFGIYMLMLGCSLILVPNLMLSVFRFPLTTEVWIRVAGVLVFNIGVYYIYAAKSEMRAFFMASVFTRIFVLMTFSSFVLLGFASPALILIGSVDFAGGIWTYITLKSEMAD